MTTDHRIIVRDNYNAVAQRVAAEWAALDAGHGCDPTRLAQDTAALIDALKQQRDAAVTALTDIMRLAGDHVFSSAPQENRALMAAMAMWHVYGDPPTGWLRLTRWYGTETTQRDFCSIGCMLVWMPKALDVLGR